MNLRGTIESLQEDLKQLSLTSASIRRTIKRLERELDDNESHRAKKEEASDSSNSIVFPISTATDRDGTVISRGCRVTFLTSGKNKSKGGFVVRFSKNQERVFVVDLYGHEIARAPRNVRIVSQDSYNVLP